MRTTILAMLSLSFFLLCGCGGAASEKSNERPNIIFILADDLGYGDLGSYGQEKIETPNLDQLAAGGMRFTQHYSGSPVCAPSRCVLLTGLHTGHAYVRGNDEWGSRGDVWDYRAMLADSTLEGQRPLPDSTLSIASLMKEGGYRTAMVGKWGLGAPHTESVPNKMGFDFFCGYNCQRMAHTYYPTHLYRNERRLHMANDTLAPHSKKLSDVSLTDYAPDVMFREMTSFLAESSEKPFFLYWASPIPHLPLQAPDRWVEYYREKFGEEEPYIGDHGYFPSQHPHATYAAMVSYLDERIGELIAQLKEMGEYENTLIIFSSDNGPTYNVGGADSPWFDSGGPFSSEHGWGKGFLHEGGIRVPLIASWPGQIAAGAESDHLSAFWDLLPTLCEAAQIVAPSGLDGISYLPALKGQDSQKEHPYLYWEFPAYGGQQAVRMGPWKAIRKDILKGNMELELYNLDGDLVEQHNVASEEPELIRQLENIMVKEHRTPDIKRFMMDAIEQ